MTVNENKEVMLIIMMIHNDTKSRLSDSTDNFLIYNDNNTGKTMVY